MIHFNQIPPLFLLVATPTAGTEGLMNSWVQYGFLSIILAGLFWYSKKAYARDEAREKAAEAERIATQLRHDAEKLAIITRYEKAAEAERQRYHELHLEVLTFFKSHKHIGS